MESLLDHLNQINKPSLAQILIVCELSSGFFSFAIIVCYLRYKQLRNDAFRLVFHLSLAGFLKSFSSFVATKVNSKREDSGFCQIEGFFYNIFQLQSFLFVLAISYFVRKSISGRIDNVNLKHEIKNAILIIYCFSFVSSIIPFYFNQYGAVNHYCWIKLNEQTFLKGIILRLLNFYIPVWCTFFYCSITYIITRKKLEQENLESKEIEIFTIRLKIYPLFLLISYFGGSFNRLFQIIGFSSSIFESLQIIFTSLNGFFNALIYGMTQTVIETISQDLFSRNCFQNITQNSNQKQETPNQNQNCFQKILSKIIINDTEEIKQEPNYKLSIDLHEYSNRSSLLNK